MKDEGLNPTGASKARGMSVRFQSDGTRRESSRPSSAGNDGGAARGVCGAGWVGRRALRRDHAATPMLNKWKTLSRQRIVFTMALINMPGRVV